MYNLVLKANLLLK